MPLSWFYFNVCKTNMISSLQHRGKKIIKNMLQHDFFPQLIIFSALHCSAAWEQLQPQRFLSDFAIFFKCPVAMASKMMPMKSQTFRKCPQKMPSALTQPYQVMLLYLLQSNFVSVLSFLLSNGVTLTKFVQICPN